jgi:peroxiredoxin
MAAAIKNGELPAWQQDSFGNRMLCHNGSSRQRGDLHHVRLRSLGPSNQQQRIGPCNGSNHFVGISGLKESGFAMRFQVGDKFPALTLTTSKGKAISIPDPDSKWTHVQFRRWTGCPICNTHIGQLRKSADRIAAAGIHEVLFFHSSQEQVAEFQTEIPFDLVGDRNKKYYRLLGVESSWVFALNFKTLLAAAKGMLSGRFNLAMTGGPFGLPAEFLVAPDGGIAAVQYGTHAYDQWSAEELLGLARSSQNKEVAIPTAAAPALAG